MKKKKCSSQALSVGPYRYLIQKNASVEVQLAPMHDHRANTVERKIRGFNASALHGDLAGIEDDCLLPAVLDYALIYIYIYISIYTSCYVCEYWTDRTLSSSREKHNLLLPWCGETMPARGLSISTGVSTHIWTHPRLWLSPTVRYIYILL